MAAHRFLRHLHVSVTQTFDQPSAQDDDLGIQEVHAVRYPDPEVARRALDDPVEGRFPVLVVLREDLALVVGYIGSGDGDDLRQRSRAREGDGVLRHRGPARQGLEAAVLAAAAEGTVELDDHVSDLSRASCRAPEELAVQYEPSAYTGSRKDADDVAVTPSGPADELAVGSRVDVVLEEDRNSEFFRDLAGEGEVFEREVRSLVDDPLLRVDRTWDRDADTPDIVHRHAGVRHRRLYERDHLRDHRLGSLRGVCP